MATPDFILRLRDKIGHELLPMSCAGAVVLDAEGRILLGRRSDDGRWALPGGIIEPGEQPARAAIREIEEETGIRVAVERLVSVVNEAPIEFANGDRCQVLALTFLCRHVAGDVHPADGENTDVRWFRPGELPPVSDVDRGRIARALRDDPQTYFVG